MITMQRIPVHSTNLSAIGYDPEKNELEIVFNTGYIYKYYGVPEYVYKALMEAKSHGKYFHTHIKKQYQQVRTK